MPNLEDPADRAAMDQATAYAVDAVMRQAHRFEHLDSAEANYHLGIALILSRLPREQLAAVLAALAVHVARTREVVW